ncbi:MAG TPA: caspase family protein, partial [Thermoanaerobaculia bacterium]
MSINDPLNDQVGTKFALVIGNSYAGVDLISGEADAAAMADALRKLDFSVTSLSNGTVDQIKAALKDFRGKIEKARVVVFFYSGHGY